MAKDKRKPGERWSSERNYKLPIDLHQEFYDKVVKMAEKMFGRDCDGDLPIDIHIIDRTRFEPNHSMDVPYRHKIEEEVMNPVLTKYEEATPEELEQAEKLLSEKLEARLISLSMNVRMAMERLDCELKMRQYDWHEKQRKKNEQAMNK